MFPKYIFSLLCLIPLCLILLCSIPISCYATFCCACFRYAWFQIAHFNVMTDSCSLLCLIPLCLITLCLIPVLMKPRYAWFRYTRFRCTWFHFCMLCPIPLCQVPPSPHEHLVFFSGGIFLIIPRFSKSLAWPGLSRSDAYLAVFFVDFTYGKHPLVVLFNIPSRSGKLVIIHH